MRRLCIDSSRSYLGRSALHGGVVLMDMNGPGCAGPKTTWREIVSARSHSERTGRDPSRHAARLAVMHRVRPQKSAEVVVVFRYFTRVAVHEGPNMRSREEQW